jgi:tetratricopeptide (TPR) repeat protein
MLKDCIALHRQGRFDEAEQGYRAHLAAQPDDADALHLLGMLRYQRGDFAEGGRLLERAHALAPDDPGIELSLASLHFRSGNHEDARRGFHRALTLDPNLSGAHAGLGQIALMRNEREVAEQHFRIALRAGEEPHALAGLGALLLERGDADGALRYLMRAAELAAGDAMIQLLLGRAFLAKGTIAFAETALRNALRLRPGLPQARHLLGSLLIREKRTAEAAEEYRALQDDAEFGRIARVALADIARAEGRLAEAASAYQAALAQAPTDTAVARALAWTLGQLGRTAEAVEAYDACLALEPDDDSLRTARADLLMVGGRLPEAAVAWKELLERDPANLFARSRFAITAEYLGQVGAAQAHAELVLRAREDNEMQLIRIRALLHSGDDADARAALDALAANQPTIGQHRLQQNYLGRLHDRAGEVEQAVACFAEAQRGTCRAMPPLQVPNPALVEALAEPAGEPWPDAPVLLLGTPGSGVERVAALLADQPGLAVLRDRAAAAVRVDDFTAPRFPLYAGELDAGLRAALRDRWLAPLRAAGIGPGRTVVDWLPRWDAHLLALVRRAMPGTRLVIVERDPRDALLNWLGFGWAAGFPCGEPLEAADWLARARHHLAFGSELDDPRRLVVAADPLLDDPEGNGAALAAFLGLDELRAGTQFAAMRLGLGGLPVRFPAGHWQAYREVLAEPFRRLH